MEIDRGELEDAFMFMDVGNYDNQAFICRKTGKIYLRTDYDAWDNEEPLPDDLDDADKYIELPSKRDLDLGKNLVFRFVDAELPDDYERVQDIFASAGAYARFKSLLERRGVTPQLHFPLLPDSLFSESMGHA